MGQRRCFCHHGRVGIKCVVAANHLAGPRRVQSQLAGHVIDAVRIAELRFGQPQLAVLLLEQLRCCFSASTLYPYSMALKCCQP